MTTKVETWNWNQSPFSTSIDGRRFFPGISQEEGMSRLHFLVENRRRLGLLAGPSGVGKSMLLDVAARQLRQQGNQIVSLSLLGLDDDEFIWKLAAGLGANPLADAQARKLWRDIDDRILANRYQRVGTVLLFDDAEEAETDVLQSLQRLAQFDQSDDSRLTIVLASDAARTRLLGQRLQDLSELRIDLEPWDLDELQQFITWSLQRVGCGDDIFSPEAVRRIHRFSGGLPRKVQQLCQLCLVAAVGQDLTTIDEDTVDAVFEELSVR